MKLSTATVLADARAAWARDRDLLWVVAGAFFFVPFLALYLVVPPLPTLPQPSGEAADKVAQAEIYLGWVRANGHWYMLATLMLHFGMLLLLTLYLDVSRPDLRAALGRAARSFPQYLLAMILVGVPSGIGFFWILLLLPGLYLLGRMIVVGPLLVAERPIGIVAAIRRSWAITRGNGLVMAGFASVNLLGGLAAAPLLAIDRMLRNGGAANPVAIVIVDAGAAMLSAAALLALVLLQVAVYRRMAPSSGI